MRVGVTGKKKQLRKKKKKIKFINHFGSTSVTNMNQFTPISLWLGIYLTTKNLSGKMLVEKW